MSRTIRFGGEGGKLPRGRKPVPEISQIVGNVLRGLSGVGEVSQYGRPTSVPRGRPHLAVSSVYKDQIRLAVRGHRIAQEVFVECNNPLGIKSEIERICSTRRSIA